MSMLSAWASTNPLIRRVRRHTALATLFRSRASDARPAAVNGPALVMGSPLVQLSVAATPEAPTAENALFNAAENIQENVPENFPARAISPGLAAMPSSGTTAASPATPFTTMPTLGLPSGAAPAAFAGGTAATVVQTAKAAGEPAEMALPLPSSGAMPVQATAQNHPVAPSVQPAMARAVTQAMAPASNMGTLVQTSTAYASPISPSPISPAAAALPVIANAETPAMPQTSMAAPAQPPLSEEDRIWQRLQNIRRAHELRASQNSASHSTSQATVQRASEAIEPPQGATTPNQAATTPLPETMGQSSGRSEPVASIQPVADSTLSGGEPPQNEVEAEIQEDTSPQRLPLEAAWPVHTADIGPTGGDQHPALVQRMLNAPYLSEAEEASHRILHESVNQKLRAIEADQPTESAVDILAPRRPRPLRRAEAIEQTSEQMAAGGVPPTPSLPVQRQIETSPGRAGNEVNLERSGEVSGGESAATVAQQTLVPTEVGPLPSDLWNLIGATPPTMGPARSRSTTPASQSAPPTVAATTPALAPPSSAIKSAAAPVPGAIQRSAEVERSLELQNDITQGGPTQSEPAQSIESQPSAATQQAAIPNFVQRSASVEALLPQAATTAEPVTTGPITTGPEIETMALVSPPSEAVDTATVMPSPQTAEAHVTASTPSTEAAVNAKSKRRKSSQTTTASAAAEPSQSATTPEVQLQTTAQPPSALTGQSVAPDSIEDAEPIESASAILPSVESQVSAKAAKSEPIQRKSINDTTSSTMTDATHGALPRDLTATSERAGNGQDNPDLPSVPTLALDGTPRSEMSTPATPAVMPQAIQNMAPHMQRQSVEPQATAAQSVQRPAPAYAPQPAFPVPQVATTLLPANVAAASPVVQRATSAPPDPITQESEAARVEAARVDVAKVEAANPEMRQESSTAGRSVQQNRAVAPQSTPPASQPAAATSSSVIQREGSENAPANPAGGETKSGDAEGEKGKGDDAKIDTDELARKVYGQLKRKLALEGERIGLSRF